jgi:RNA polymerase sigma factor (sigma-70 family)
LFNAVIDRLRQDAFRVLREFTSRASITTYLTTIVVNLARDRYRSEKGRNRSRERAEQHGEVGNLLHQLVIEKEFTPEAAHEWLTREKGIAISLSRIIDIITDLKGRRRLTIDPNAAAVVIDDDADETGEVHFTLRDERPLQDERLIGAHRELLRKQVLDEFIGGLSGEERLMFRMRFPADEEEEAKSFSEIARFTGLTEKAVDHRVRRLLAGFREKLLKRGIGLDDLLGSG